MLRILHVVPTYLPAVRYGGPIYSVHATCRALATRGHDVHVFTTNVDGVGTSAVPVAVPVAIDGVKVRYYPVPALRRLYWSPRLGAGLRHEVGSFDIVHAHSVFLWPTWAAARIASRKHVPYIISPRGMLVSDLIRRKSRWAKTAWIRLIESRNLAHAAAIHVTSEIEAKELERFDFRARAVRIIPNGVDAISRAEGGTPASETATAIATGGPYLLFIGRVNWKKGLDRLIRTLALVPGIRLVVAGNDEDGHRRELDAVARDCSVSDRVKFLGPVYGTDKEQLLKGAAALVLTSYSENFGNVVLEAMAAGRPVVTTPEVGASSLVLDCRAGLVLRGDPPTLAAGIRALLADPDTAAAMGQRGRDAATTRYSWDRVAKDIEDLYASVLSTRT